MADAKAGQKLLIFVQEAAEKRLSCGVMRDGGPLACDTDKSRLEKLAPRLQRAGVSNINLIT